jgi:hypothetical protein
MRARYQDLLYTNDDIRPMLATENGILVAIHPVNEDAVHHNFYGREYGIFVLNTKYAKLGKLLGRITVIHRIIRRSSEEGFDDEKGK